MSIEPRHVFFAARSSAGLRSAMCAAALMVAAVAFLLPGRACAQETGTQNGGTQIGAAKVAVVDIAAVINEYPRWIELRRELVKQHDEINERDRQVSEKLKGMRAQALGYDEGSEEHKAVTLQVNLEAQMAQFRSERDRARLSAQDFRNTLEVYEDVDYAIDRVAKKKGIDVVLARQVIPIDPQPLAEQSDEQVQRQVRMYDSRQVLWASQRLDITSEVIIYIRSGAVPARAERVPQAQPAGANAPGRPGDAAAAGNGSGTTGSGTTGSGKQGNGR